MHGRLPCMVHAPQILSDSNLVTAAYINAAMFVFFIGSFVYLQSKSILYKFRLVGGAGDFRRRPV